LDLLRIRNLPFSVRRNFYYEYKHIIPWSVVAGLIEGQFACVVLAQSFQGSPFLIAVAAATPMAARLFSLVWGMLCTGRRKIPLLMGFAGATSFCMVLIGFIPPTYAGAVLFVILMAVAQVLLSGVVTVRSAVWRSNYPQSQRGRISARIQAMRMFMSIVAVLIAAELCDRDPNQYRIIFPAAALLGFASLLIARRIHIRGERRELRRNQETRTDPNERREFVEPFTLIALLSPGHVIGQMVRVLVKDRRYALYCLAQFLLGLGNLMTIAVVIMLITRNLPLDFSSGYWISTGLIVAIPNLVMLGSVGRWGSLFDRIGVLRMRVVNVACWLVALMLGFAAALVVLHADRIGPVSLPLAVLLFGARAIGYGLGMGGGALAWNLGHLHFAEPERAEIYMGIHVSFTGLRGLVAPLLGMWLWTVIGWWLWIIAIGLTLLSELSFWNLARREAIDAAKRAETSRSQ
jgi:MFS family permease